MNTPSALWQDVEAFDPLSTLDSILIDLYNKHVDPNDSDVTRVFRLILRRLWYSEKLSPHQDDMTTRFAALDLASGGIAEYGMKAAQYDFAAQIDEWALISKRCKTRIDELFGNDNKLPDRVHRHVVESIQSFQKFTPNKEVNSIPELVLFLYATVADKLTSHKQSANLTYDPTHQFQIEVVTHLKFCGGKPGTFETLNISQFSDWDIFQKYLTHASMNWQSAMLGFPQGYSLSNGKWLYQMVDNGVVQPGYHEMRTDSHFNSFLSDMLFHQKPDRIPRFIHTLQYQVPETLKDKQIRLNVDPDFGWGGIYDRTDSAGYAYMKLPPAFMPAPPNAAETIPRTAAEIAKIQAEKRIDEKKRAGFARAREAVEREKLTGAKEKQKQRAKITKARYKEKKKQLKKAASATSSADGKKDGSSASASHPGPTFQNLVLLPRQN